MSYEWFISLRYLKAKRKQTFISIITLISVAGVALGVAALIIVISTMSGFDHDLKNKILGTKHHLDVTASTEQGFSNYTDVMAKIQKTPGIVACAPYVTAQGMLQSDDYLQGVALLGIDQVTLDADLHTILARSGATGPSVIRLRLQGLGARAVVELVQSVLTGFQADLTRGCLVTVKARKTTCHRLPVGNFE